jgi:hypothetical protein
MNMDDCIEAQKQRLLHNSEANGEFGCLLCNLGGRADGLPNIDGHFSLEYKDKEDSFVSPLCLHASHAMFLPFQ